MNVPEKHRAIAHAWVDGAGVQKIVRYVTHNEWVDESEPLWHEDTEYRIKPKPKVKKWRWVLRCYNGDLVISDKPYSDADALMNASQFVQKIDVTEKEFDE